MVWQNVNGTNPAEIAISLNSAVPQFSEGVLIFIWAMIAFFNYNSTAKKGYEHANVVDSLAIAGFVVCLIGAMGLAVGIISLTSLLAGMALTILFAAFSLFSR